MNKILLKKILLSTVTLLLPLLPCIALAANNPYTFDSFTPPNTDISIMLLERIFGHVGSSLVGAQDTILGQLFGIFNAGILAVASLFLTYTTVKIIVDVAHNIDMLSRKMSHWVVIRTAVGIGALVPSFNGYSALQILVMWFVVQGVGFADKAWETSLQYLQKGGIIYSEPSKNNTNDSEIDKKLIDGKTSNPIKIATSTQVLRSTACMQTINRILQDQIANEKQKVKDHPEKYTDDQKQAINNLDDNLTLKPYYDEAQRKVSYPGFDQTKPGPYPLPNNLLPFLNPTKLQGVCGIYTWTIFNGNNNEDHNAEGNIKNFENAKESGLKQMNDLLNQTTGSLLDKAYAKETISSDLTDNSSSSLVTAASDYQTVVYIERVNAGADDSWNPNQENDTNNPQKTKWIAQALKDKYGWIMAGSYYYQLATKTTGNSSLDSIYYLSNVIQSAPNTNQNDIEGYTSWTNLMQTLQGNNKDIIALKQVLDWSNTLQDKAISLADDMNKQIRDRAEKDKNFPTLSSSPEEDTQSFFSYKFKLGEGVKDPNTTVNIGSNDSLPINSPILNMLTDHVNQTIDAWFNIMVKNKTADGNDATNLSPINKLFEMGQVMRNQASGIWTDIINYMIMLAAVFGTLQAIPLGLSIVANAVLGFMGAGIPLGETAIVVSSTISMIYHIVSSIVFIGLPLVIACTTPMFLSGVMLSVYIPLLPFIIFTFGVIGWFIYVIEAMAAAPLVALGLTHPEGHDLLGKAEQAVMLLLSVFLRPICMVIGLVVGIVLSYVALNVLNAGFGFITYYAFNGHPESPFIGIMIIVVYTFITVALMNQCFSTIDGIPRKIMNWIGLHPEASDIPHLVESVKGEVGKFAEAPAHGTGQSISEGKGSVGVGNQAGQTATELVGKGHGLRESFEKNNKKVKIKQ